MIFAQISKRLTESSRTLEYKEIVGRPYINTEKIGQFEIYNPCNNSVVTVT